MGTFWQGQCPARSAGLEHAHADVCRNEHRPIHFSDQCCECGARATDYAEPTRIIEVTSPIFAAVEIAMRGGDIQAEIEEPKMVTGEGAQGTPHGIGRGPLWARDIARLNFYVNFLRGRGLRRELD